MAAVETKISEICVAPQPTGVRAVYLIETGDAGQARHIADLFDSLGPNVRVRQLSSGRLVSYAIELGEPDCSLLDEIESALKAAASFVVMQRSFDEVVYRIVAELCEDTSSRLLSVPHCDICGRTVPFPAVFVSLSDGEGRVKIRRSYCGSCAAGATATSNKEFVRSLLTSDKRKIRGIERAELIRRSSRKQPIRFRISQNV